MDIEEIKKELTENMKAADVDYANYPENGEYPEGYASGCEYAIELLENLQEKKVIIPQFVADWIEEYSGCCSRLEIVNQIILNKTFENDWWLNSGDNQELLLKAITNGYEVEKEKKYRVKIKGFSRFIYSYVNYNTSDDTFELNSKLEAPNIKTAFTKRWLKDNFPEYEAYNNAGLFEFEEVEDD